MHQNYFQEYDAYGDISMVYACKRNNPTEFQIGSVVFDIPNYKQHIFLKSCGTGQADCRAGSWFVK